MTSIVRRLLFAAALLVLPSIALAQTYSRPYFVAPSFGVNAGGDTADSSPAVGFSVGWLGHKWIGIEADLAWTSDFFEQDGFRISRRARTFMVNGLFQLPYGAGAGLHPYGAAGFGTVSPHLADAGEIYELDSTEPGFNVGGGAMWVKHGVGIRGDVRYFRITGDSAPNSFGIDLSDFGFWRTSLGLVVKF